MTAMLEENTLKIQWLLTQPRIQALLEPKTLVGADHVVLPFFGKDCLLPRFLKKIIQFEWNNNK